MEESGTHVAESLNQFRPVLLTLAEAMISSTLRGDLEASDLVQQTLLEAHCNAEQLAVMSKGAFFAWLRSALNHNLLDAVKHLKAQKNDVRRRVRESDLEASFIRLEQVLIADETSPSDVLQRNEQICIMLAALQTLPDNQRIAVIMKHFNGQSLKEIAEIPGLSEPAAAGVLHRGRQRLGCATKRNLAQKILGELYSGRGTHRLTRLGEEAFSRLHFVQPSSSPSRVKRSLPLTTKSSSEKSPNFLETAICRAPHAGPTEIHDCTHAD